MTSRDVARGWRVTFDQSEKIVYTIPEEMLKEGSSQLMYRELRRLIYQELRRLMYQEFEFRQLMYQEMR